MTRVALLDFNGKIPNLALMKLSMFWKLQGATVSLNPDSVDGYDVVAASVVFDRDKPKAEELRERYPHMEIGGNAWDITKKLPAEVECLPPDYALYAPDHFVKFSRGIRKTETRLKNSIALTQSAIGFSSRGCVRRCSFCQVPKAEGPIRQHLPLGEIVRKDSNRLILLDNNICADPLALEKLAWLAERKVVVDICQGLDMRLMTDELAAALGRVKHAGYVHLAWDSVKTERQTLEGIRTLTKYVRAYRLMCYILVGFDSTEEEDLHRVRVLDGMGMSPYIMPYNQNAARDKRLQHFTRWVNSRVYKVCPNFEDYEPLKRANIGRGVG